MLALAYRQEAAHLGITVGLVHPSWIDTDLVRGAEADLPSFQELRRGCRIRGYVTTSVDRAGAAIVRGLGTGAVAYTFRALLSSPTGPRPP